MGVPIGAGVSVGPHPHEPQELADLMRSAAGPAAREETLEAGRAAWLLDVLDGAGVVLGDGDREVLRLITALRPSATQVVAGWIARSTHPLHGLRRCDDSASQAGHRPSPR